MTTVLTFSNIDPRLGKQRSGGRPRRAHGRAARRLSAALLAAGLAATAALILGAGENADLSAGKARSEAQRVGVFTGEFANGIPVYRFPPVTVVATRKPELGKTACEELPTPAKYRRAEAILDRACGSDILAALALNVWTQ